MSAETLRRAATGIRADLAFGQERGAPELLAAVADWLEDVADGQAHGWGSVGMKHALAVARAYLGEPA